ncbi:hypothetical protein Tco_0210764 [Tanacetum coccineum]
MDNLRVLRDKALLVAFLRIPTESVGFTEIVDFIKGTSLRYALTHNSTIYDSLVKQFWQTATVRSLANGIQELVTSIDNKEYTITEAFCQNKLHCRYATGGYAGELVPLVLAMLAGAAEDQGEAQQAQQIDRQDTEIPQSQGPTITRVADEATTTRVGVETEGSTINLLDAWLDSGNIHESPIRTKKVVVSNSEYEETENQGRKIQNINDDPLVSLVRESMKEADFVTPTKTVSTYKRIVRSTDKGKDISTSLDVEAEVNTGSEDFNPDIKEKEKHHGYRSGIQATKRKKAQIQQEKVGFAEAMRLKALQDEEAARQVHFDALLAKRI